MVGKFTVRIQNINSIVLHPSTCCNVFLANRNTDNNNAMINTSIMLISACRIFEIICCIKCTLLWKYLNHHLDHSLKGYLNKSLLTDSKSILIQ